MTSRRVLALLFASACVAPGESETTEAVINARTVVSLTFDDTLADQVQVGDMAAARGMRVTFYINSPRLGASGYMTKAQVIALEQAGHEIGGHTLTHANLPTLSDADARNQICNDRAAFLAQGFRVTSFAYPFGADNTAVQQIARDCGYNSARDVGGLQSTTYASCQGCPWTNPVPPANLYEIRTNDSIHTDTTLQQMEQYVLDAEQHGGGYVPIVMHHVCSGCDPDSVSVATLGAFMDWLQQRGPNTQVGTVDQEIGGAVRPAVTYPAQTTPSGNLAKNPSLETDANNDQVPDCWQRDHFGTNTATYSLVTDAFDGTRAQRIAITSFSSGGSRLFTAQDSGTCAPATTVGHRYTVTAYYKANVQPRLTVYYRNASGSWQWFAESALLPTSTAYRQATFTTPALPSGATAISMGLGIYSVGTLTMDASTITDIDGTTSSPTDTAPPSTTISCNGTACSPNAYSAPVSVSLAGWDFSGIRQIRYTVNGSDPAVSGTVYSAPFTVNATTTVRAIVTDNANNTATLSKTVRITSADTTPPTLSIACNGTACTSTPYAGSVSVSLAAADAGGLRDIRYTLNGSDPAVSGTVYSAPFTISSTTTVRAVARDNAGNSTPLTTTIQVTAADTTPPTLSIACNGMACTSAAYTAPVSVSLTANDTSGIREIRYSVDGSNPSPSGTIYTNPFTVASTTTVRAIATDTAGNTTTLTQTIQINAPSDTTPPSLAIACNGTTCSPSAYAAPVSVSLTASDASGIRDIKYTLNGSDPAVSGTVYAGPFTVSTTATVRAIATDNANNTTTLSQVVQVNAPSDTTPPSLAIACNGASCSSSYTAPVTVALTAGDASGIRDIKYTLNGADPATSGAIYTAPFTVSSTATVRAVATDNAGNATALSQLITINSAPANLLKNASLETDANGDQTPDCWGRGGFGTNTSTFAYVSDAFDGTRAEQVTITAFTSGARRLYSLQDTGACAPAVTAGRSYTMTAYYKATVQPRFSVYYRSTSGAWVWFAESAPLATTSTYTRATYTTPAMPADATAISISLSIFGVGSVTSDAYTLVQAP